MKRAQLHISPQMFVDAFKGGIWQANTSLPADTRVVDVAYIHSAGRFVLVIESALFRDGLEPIIAPALRAVVSDEQ